MTSPYVLYSLKTLDYKLFLHITQRTCVTEYGNLCNSFLRISYLGVRLLVKSKLRLSSEVIECSVEFFFEARGGIEANIFAYTCY